jgi:hypothetical protein
MAPSCYACRRGMTTRDGHLSERNRLQKEAAEAFIRGQTDWHRQLVDTITGIASCCLSRDDEPPR